MEANKLLEKLGGLDHLQASRDNYKILAFATEVTNVVLELRNEVETIDKLRERIERLEDASGNSST